MWQLAIYNAISALFNQKVGRFQYFHSNSNIKRRPGMITCCQKGDPSLWTVLIITSSITLWNGRGNSQHKSLKVHPKLPTSTPIQPPLPRRPGRTPKVNLKEQEDHPAGAQNIEARIPLATYWNTNSSFKFAPWYDPDGSPFESRQSCIIRVKMVERVVLCVLGGWF